MHLDETHFGRKHTTIVQVVCDDRMKKCNVMENKGILRIVAVTGMGEHNSTRVPTRDECIHVTI